MSKTEPVRRQASSAVWSTLRGPRGMPPAMPRDVVSKIASIAGTPQPIVEELSRTTCEALQAPAVQDAGKRLGMDMRGSTPEQVTARLKNDIAKWTDVVEKTHIPKMD